MEKVFPMIPKQRHTKSVLHSDWLFHISWVRLASSVDGHDSEAVKNAIIQVDHLKFGLLAGVWSLVRLETTEGKCSMIS